MFWGEGPGSLSLEEMVSKTTESHPLKFHSFGQDERLEFGRTDIPPKRDETET